MSSFKPTGESSKSSRKRKTYTTKKDVSEEGEFLKSLYISITPYRGGYPILIHSDVHDGVFYRGLKSDFPTHLVDCGCYTVFSVKSKVYFVGGYKLLRLIGLVLDDVSVFDLDSLTWRVAASMKQKRACPIVLAYQKNIYAFGSNACTTLPKMVLSPDTFAELYDPVTNRWSYLPCNPPDEILLPENAILSHSFDEAKGVVYFWLASLGVYSYHFESRSWDILKVPSSGPVWTFDPRIGLRWSLSTVFFDSFIIWHYFGTIYAYHCSDHSILTLFTFENSSHKFGTPETCSSPSYLVNVGDHKLCLVYGCQHHKDTDTIRCHTFDIEYLHTSSNDIKLTHTGCKVYHCEGYCISSVFTADRHGSHDGEREYDIQFEPKKEVAIERTTDFEYALANLARQGVCMEKIMALQRLDPELWYWDSRLEIGKEEEESK